jgi:tetratricopeptide (TPR) repeat protein
MRPIDRTHRTPKARTAAACFVALLLVMEVLGGGFTIPELAAQDASGDLGTAERILAQARGHEDPDVRVQLYDMVESRARAALEEDPSDIDARWWLVATLGLRADEESARRKIQLAGEVHEEAERILEVDPDHPGAHHAVARLHAGILRLNRVVRYVALRLVGEETLREADWEGAEWHIQRAIEQEPDILIHRYERVRMLQTQGRLDEAREELENLFSLPDTAPMDPVVRSRAERLRSELGEG